MGERADPHSPTTLAYGSSMCSLMRDLLTQTTKCAAYLGSYSRDGFECSPCKLVLQSKCVCVCVFMHMLHTEYHNTHSTSKVFGK